MCSLTLSACPGAEEQQSIRTSNGTNCSLAPPTASMLIGRIRAGLGGLTVSLRAGSAQSGSVQLKGFALKLGHSNLMRDGERETPVSDWVVKVDNVRPKISGPAL